VTTLRRSSAQTGKEASTLAKGILTRVFAGTQVFATGFFLTLLFLFFLLVYGDTFLRRVVEILPRFGDKRRAVEISRRSKAIFRST
jgi:predicted PurR-regulated permease PerM